MGQEGKARRLSALRGAVKRRRTATTECRTPGLQGKGWVPSPRPSGSLPGCCCVPGSHRKAGSGQPLFGPLGQIRVERRLRRAFVVRLPVAAHRVAAVHQRLQGECCIPLAMARINAAKLPYSFRLDDTMSMTPNVRLSSAKSVVIGARISRKGDALAQPGDFEGLSAPVAVGSSNVAVTIGTIVK